MMVIDEQALNDFVCGLHLELEKATERAGDGGPIRDGQIGVDPSTAYRVGVRDGLQRAVELIAGWAIADDEKHGPSSVLPRLEEIDDRSFAVCPQCGGSGFSGRGTGYDDVCSNCIRGYVPSDE